MCGSDGVFPHEGVNGWGKQQGILMESPTLAPHMSETVSIIMLIIILILCITVM